MTKHVNVADFWNTEEGNSFEKEKKKLFSVEKLGAVFK